MYRIMKINMNEWIASVISSKERVAIPIMTHSGIEIIGKTVKDAVTDGVVHYEAIMPWLRSIHRLLHQ